MLEYKPWSTTELEKSLAKYRKGVFSILDLEVSGACNFNCMYCDSPNHKKRCSYNIKTIERIISEGDFDWVFVCGLGEPTSGKNYHLLLDILNLCKTYHMKCSIFSNVYNLTDEIIRYIDEDILHILFKFDSLDAFLNANLYGTSTKHAAEQKKNIEALTKSVHSNGNETNIGASIVPTRLNLDKIPYVIEYCLDNNIYPLIADLENSGRGQEHYSALSLSDKEKRELYKCISNMFGKGYHVPICPAVVPGIHISHNNSVVVDRITGLTCPWFWLEEPQLKTILKLSDDINLVYIQEMIMRYRNSKLDDLERFIISFKKDSTEYFGGCGGDIKELLTRYIEIQKRIKDRK